MDGTRHESNVAEPETATRENISSSASSSSSPTSRSSQSSTSSASFASFPSSASNRIREFAEKAETEGRKFVDTAYDRARHESNVLLSEARQRGRRIKEERPLALLVWMTGIAFVLGFAVRIWRLRHS